MTPLGFSVLGDWLVGPSLLAMSLAAPALPPPAPGAAPASPKPAGTAGTANPPELREAEAPSVTSPAIPEPTPEPVEAPIPPPAVPPTAPAAEGTLHAAVEREGPPFYTAADLAEFRALNGLEPAAAPPPVPARWRCLIADPTCRHSIELQAMGGYGLRFRQGDVSEGTIDRWNSARASYELWLGLPALVETEGNYRYTRLSLGPKGGATVSDTGDLWGNIGIAMRYWLGRGRWAPALEVTSGLAFKLGTRESTDIQAEKFRMQRGPVGFQLDVGVGLGGFGALVIGGQYDSPLAREDVPEEYRVVTSGMFYVGLRGNILWGGPAAVSVASHAATRAVRRP